MASTLSELDEAPPAFTDAPSEGDSLKLTRLGQELAELDAEELRLKTELEEKAQRRRTIQMKELPELMRQIGQDHIGLPDHDVDVVLEAYYHANIAADWPDEDRQRAFDYLIERGDGDLIKVTLQYDFRRNQLEDAQWARNTLKMMQRFAAELGLEVGNEIPEPTIRTGVHSGTLTAWLREETESGRGVDLAILRATVGQIAKLKARKERKRKHGRA